MAEQTDRTVDQIQAEHDQAITELGVTCYQQEILKAQEMQLKQRIYSLNKEFDAKQAAAQQAQADALAKAEQVKAMVDQAKAEGASESNG